jgi:hypothetical protein
MWNGKNNRFNRANFWFVESFKHFPQSFPQSFVVIGENGQKLQQITDFRLTVKFCFPHSSAFSSFGWILR